MFIYLTQVIGVRENKTVVVNTNRISKMYPLGDANSPTSIYLYDDNKSMVVVEPLTKILSMIQ